MKYDLESVETAVNSVKIPVIDYVRVYVYKSIYESIEKSVWISIRYSVWGFVYSSARDSIDGI